MACQTPSRKMSEMCDGAAEIAFLSLIGDVFAWISHHSSNWAGLLLLTERHCERAVTH